MPKIIKIGQRFIKLLKKNKSGFTLAGPLYILSRVYDVMRCWTSVREVCHWPNQ